MRTRKQHKDSEDIAEVRERIDRWRATRTKRSPMPAPLWDAAVRLAQTHGIYPIARRLPVNYESLQSRVGGAHGGSEPKAAKPAAPRFVELTGAQLLASLVSIGPVVEVSDARGDRLTVRLGAGSTLDVARVVAAFRGQPA